jgi:hypothetical protein
MAQYVAAQHSAASIRHCLLVDLQQKGAAFAIHRVDLAEVLSALRSLSQGKFRIEKLGTRTSVMWDVQHMRVCGTARLVPPVLRMNPDSKP